MRKGKVIYRGPLPPDAPEYKEDWTVVIGGATWKGFAKPDDPIYKEGWSVNAAPKTKKKKKKIGGAGGT